ncbi:MAG: hypothetical protein MUP40_07090 [Actinobacteria bacterium]|nr:hypothetical protein [Actinomycetota bacterium]
MVDPQKDPVTEAANKYVDDMVGVQEKLAKEAGIFGKVFQAIGQFFSGILPFIGNAIIGAIPGFWKRLRETLEADAKAGIEREFQQIWGGWVSNGMISAELAEYMKKLTASAGFVSPILSYIIQAIFIVADAKSVIQVVLEDSIQKLRGNAKNTLPDPASAIKAMFIDPSLEAAARAVLRLYGLSDDRAEMTIKASRPLLDLGTIQTLSLRGEMTEEEVKANMRAMGFTDARAEAIRKTWNVLPGPQDIIRMAVREAFSPEQVTLLGLDEAFPGAVAEWAGKAGLKEPWPLMFWRAHWELPSASMGFEMLHRGLISEADLGGLLKALDYAPIWHDRLQAIAYNVVTRVDARRLYELGVWSEEKLTEAYRKMGYGPEDADDLTAWTKVEYAHGDKEVTRSQIEQAFVKRIIDRREASDMLVSLGWSDEKAQWILDVADFTARTAIRDETIAAIKEMYMAGLATQLEVRQRLGDEEVDPDYIEVLLERWEVTKLATRKLPSKTDLDKFLKASLILEGEYKAELERLGYSAEMADRYYQLNTKGTA